jgi:hypothetical protein
MKRIIFNLVLAAVLNSLTESAKADTIVLQTTGANSVTETANPGFPPYMPPSTSYSINFSTPSINIQNGSGYFVFEYLAPSGIGYSLPNGGDIGIYGGFLTNSELGINSVVAGTISFFGLSTVNDNLQTYFYGGVNNSIGFIYPDSQISFTGPASFTGIQISIPIEGTGNNVNLGPENLQSPFTISSASMIIAESVPEPSALSLLAVGLGALAMMRRRRA